MSSRKPTNTLTELTSNKRKRKRNAIEEADEEAVNRIHTRDQQQKKSKENAKNLKDNFNDIHKKNSQQSNATIESKLTKRKRTVIEEPNDVVINRKRTRNHQSQKTMDERPSKKIDFIELHKKSSKQSNATIQSTKGCNEIVVNRMRTRSQQTNKTKDDRLNANTIEPTTKKRKRTAIEEASNAVIGQQRTRSQQTKITKNNQPNTEKIWKQNCNQQIDKPTKKLNVVLKRLTTEELKKYGVKLSKPDPLQIDQIQPIAKQKVKLHETSPREIPRNDSPRSSFDESVGVATAKPKRKGRKSTKMQLQEQMLNDAPGKEFLTNEIVLATIPGFVPWPARILNIIGQTITVEFFGTAQM